MGLFGTGVKKPVGQVSEAMASDSIMPGPVNLKGNKIDSGAWFNIERAFLFDGAYFILGWSTSDVLFSVKNAKDDLKFTRVPQARPDVLSHFSMPENVIPGFLLVCDASGTSVSLTVSDHGDSFVIELPFIEYTSETISDDLLESLAPAIAIRASKHVPFSDRWNELVDALPVDANITATSRGFIEMARSSPTGDAGFVSGWALAAPGAVLWLENSDGAKVSLDIAFRQYRADVYDAFVRQCNPESWLSGFLAAIPTASGRGLIQLKELSAGGVSVLAELETTQMPGDARECATTLFAIGCDPSRFAERVGIVDRPVLEPILSRRTEKWASMKIEVHCFGPVKKNPKVSIIVPLYARVDFVEHQLIEFSKDQWLLDNAEIIYVLDDPSLQANFASLAAAVHKIYKVPFRWVFGCANRGFSGANNLGSSVASGDHILFLNSDAFPHQPGWLQQLVAALESDSDIGIVAPRLVHGDGSIQHAGMEYVWHEDLQLWKNHHPFMGLAAKLDPYESLVEVEAVTGACMLIRRSTFNQIGGWDEGFLIGDFEDSDLCLKCQDASLKVMYLPTVELVHLERQSFKTLGHDVFRGKVANYNAARQTQKWGTAVAALKWLKRDKQIEARQ